MTTFDVTTIASMPRHSRIVGRERKQLIAHLKRQYRSGLTVAELAAETGRSPSFVSRLLDETGVARRTAGGARKKT